MTTFRRWHRTQPKWRVRLPVVLNRATANILSLLWLCQRHILEAYLSLGNDLAIVAARDGDAPELLRASLNDWLADKINHTLTHRPQKIGCVVDANREQPLMENRRRCADTGDTLDGGCIDATVDNAPWRVMPGAQIEMRCDAHAADLIKYQTLVPNPGSPRRQVFVG